MSFEEDERNRRQLREIEDLRQAMRSRYISVAWIKKWAMKSKNTYNREQIIEMLNDWEEENEID